MVFADVHEDGRYLYPGTGAAEETGRGAAAGTKLNLPVPPGADDAVFAEVWPQVIAHLEKFDPEFIILQCGADSLEGDPITHLRFTADSHGRAARELSAAGRPLRSRAGAGPRGRGLQPQQSRPGLEYGGREPDLAPLARVRRP